VQRLCAAPVLSKHTGGAARPRLAGEARGLFCTRHAESAHPIGTEEAKHLAPPDGEVEVADRRKIPVALAQALKRDHVAVPVVAVPAGESSIRPLVKLPATFGEL
jgi:hypothetical protein